MMFSIIVPIYNVAEYLEECISSVLNQKYSDYELILVNDGSSDESGDICRKYAASDSRIKYICKENGGLTSARKAGCSVAEGDYVVCLDGDDALLPEFLTKTADIIERFRPDCICTDFIAVTGPDSVISFSNKYPVGLYEGQELNTVRNNLHYSESIAGSNSGKVLRNIWSKVLKREIYMPCQMELNEAIGLGEDIALVSAIFMRLSNVYFSDIVSHKYYVRQDSMSHSFSPRDVESTINVILHAMKNLGECNQVAVLGMNLFSLVFDKASKLYSYRDVKRMVVNLYKANERVYRFIRTATVSKNTFIGSVRLFLIRHRLFYPVYLFYKYRRTESSGL